MKSFLNAFLAFLALVVLASCVEQEEQITDLRGKVKFETISVSNKLAGRIKRIYVDEGQMIKQGDTLAIIDIPEVQAKIMQSEGAITAARGQLNLAMNGATTEQLNQVEGKIDAAKAQLNFAQQSYDRLEAMYTDSLVSLQQLDEVRMKRDMAQAQVSALEAKRTEVVNGARTEQIQQAQGQLSRALGAREEVLSAAGERVMLAPVDMTVETISLQEGELLTPAFTLFNGYKANSLFFRFTVPESKVYSFEVGQELTLVNPFTKEETLGKVAAIKQLPQYADITSTYPLYELDESIYELKVVPTSDASDQSFFLNATILIKQ